MDISYIQVFLTVAEEMNFSRAAKKLFMTQQAVSNTIQKMENEYGIQLFERKPVLKLTSAGQEMKEYGANVVANYEAMRHALQSTERNYTTKLRVGMSSLCNVAFFTDILLEYRKIEPKVCLEAFAARSGSMQKKLHGGELSVCVAMNLMPDEHMVVKELTKQHPCCGISLKLLQRYHPEITGSDMKRMEKEGIPLELLKDIPCFAQSEESPWVVRKEKYSRLMQKNLAGIADQSIVLYKLAKTGEGYSMLFPITHYRYRDEVNRPESDMWILPFACETDSLGFCVAYSKDYKLSQEEEELVEVIERVGGRFVEFMQKQGYTNE